MLLSKLKIGDIATIQNITSSDETQDRLYSLGICEGVELKVQRYSIAKQTITVQISNQTIALGLSEANCIKVKI